MEPREITKELGESYLDYAMSVIVARALPDVRDGMKPVHRRVLWAMWDMGVLSTAKFRKSAYVVGETMAKYHPHGDSSIYDTMVRMAQDFSLRYPLVRGQGNFGSVDGDPPAAMRYTEAKLAAIANEMLSDIEKETVDWIPNYDGTRNEPTVLPGKIAESPFERRARHRRRYGDKHPAAQFERGCRRDFIFSGQRGRHERGPFAIRKRPGFSDRRHHL